MLALGMNIDISFDINLVSAFKNAPALGTNQGNATQNHVLESLDGQDISSRWMGSGVVTEKS